MSSPPLMSARRRLLLLAVATAVLSVSTTPGGQTRQGRTTWRDYGGGPDNARFIELDQINKQTLQRLDVAWTYPTRDNLPYNFGPLVVDNVAYVLARNTSLVALDASTGQELWVHADLQGIAPRGINYWESGDRKDRRLLFQRNNFLEAIISSSAGLVFHAGGDGKLRAYDAETGRVLWTGALPAGSQGIPAMYESGGRQFILVNATQIGSGYIRGQTRPGEEPAGGYVAFALKPATGS